MRTTYANVFLLETLEINDCSRQSKLEVAHIVPGGENDGDFVPGCLKTKQRWKHERYDDVAYVRSLVGPIVTVGHCDMKVDLGSLPEAKE
jgi:hypothetical protein